MRFNVVDISMKGFVIAFSDLQFQVIPRFGIFRKVKYLLKKAQKCKQLKRANSGSHPRLHGRKCNHETFRGNIYTIALVPYTTQFLHQVISMECSLDETLNTFELHFETLFRVQCCLESSPAVSVKAITDNTVWSTQYSLPYLTFKQIF